MHSSIQHSCLFKSHVCWEWRGFRRAIRHENLWSWKFLEDRIGLPKGTDVGIQTCPIGLPRWWKKRKKMTKRSVRHLTLHISPMAIPFRIILPRRRTKLGNLNVFFLKGIWFYVKDIPWLTPKGTNAFLGYRSKLVLILKLSNLHVCKTIPKVCKLFGICLVLADFSFCPSHFRSAHYFSADWRQRGWRLNSHILQRIALRTCFFAFRDVRGTLKIQI